MTKRERLERRVAKLYKKLEQRRYMGATPRQYARLTWRALNADRRLWEYIQRHPE